MNSLKNDAVKAVLGHTNGKGVTVSFDMSGAPVAQHNAILVTGKMGRVVFLGISHKGLELSEQAVDNILRYQLAIKGCLLYTSSEQLAFSLKEDDFLDIKLGSLKPACKPVLYRELNQEERRETKQLREVMEQYIRNFDGEDCTLPFAFFEKKDLHAGMISGCADRWVLEADPECLQSEAVNQFFRDFKRCV